MHTDNKFSQFNAYSRRWKAGWITFCLLAGLWLSLNIPLLLVFQQKFNANFPSMESKVIFIALSGAALGVVLFVLTVELAFSSRDRFDTQKVISAWAPYRYAFLLVLGWGIYFLAFYPGMMSADSLDQWQQMLTGQYIDHHPPFHTLTIWLLTRLYLSPATVAAAQLLALAVVSGLCFAFLESLGVERWLLWVACCIYAFSPVNGTMVVTLWKDVPFSIAVVGFTLLIAKILWSSGEWLSKPRNSIVLGMVCALVMLFRYDGLPIGVGVLLLLIAVYPKRWKNGLLSVVVCCLLYLGVRGPLYQYVGVRAPSQSSGEAVSYNAAGPGEMANMSLSLYKMVLYVRPDTSAEKLLNQISVTGNWSCKIWRKLNPQWRETDMDPSLAFTHVVSNALRYLPRILLYDYRCLRSMEWIIYDPYGDVYNPSHAEYWIDPNPFGITPASKLPAFQKMVSAWVSRTAHDPSVSWIVWRPATFLYLHLFVVAVLLLRRRDIRISLLAAPILIQSVMFSLIPLAPNFRYHYAVYLVSLMFWPLLFSASVRDKAGNGAEDE